MNASDINTLNQVPLVQSTQILSTSAQVPMVSQVPVTPVVNTVPVVSQVPAVAQQPIQVSSVVPAGVQNPHFITTGTGAATLVDEDYRLGRGILDDFRPNAYKTQIGVVGKTTTNVVTSSTPVVSTPVVNATGSSATLKDFL